MECHVPREKAARVATSGLVYPTLGYPARGPASWHRRSESSIITDSAGVWFHRSPSSYVRCNMLSAWARNQVGPAAFPVLRCSGAPVLRCSGAPVLRCSGAPVLRCSGAPVLRCSGEEGRKRWPRMLPIGLNSILSKIVVLASSFALVALIVVLAWH